MLREYSNRNDTFRVIKLPLFLCPIIKPVNHRCDQDHILQGTAHTKQDETGFPLLTDHEREREKGEDEGKGLVSMPSLAGAEPSSAFSLTALQSGKYFPQVPTAAQMDVLGSSYKRRP